MRSLLLSLITFFMKIILLIKRMETKEIYPKLPSAPPTDEGLESTAKHKQNPSIFSR